MKDLDEEDDCHVLPSINLLFLINQMPRGVHLLATWALTLSKSEGVYELKKGVKLGGSKSDFFLIEVKIATESNIGG